jgi:hypothetical protein
LIPLYKKDANASSFIRFYLHFKISNDGNWRNARYKDLKEISLILIPIASGVLILVVSQLVCAYPITGIFEGFIYYTSGKIKIIQ